MSECGAIEDAIDAVDNNARVLAGYDTIFDTIHELQVSPNFELHLKTRVQSVEWKKGEVKVTAQSEDGERIEYAQALIVTAPPPLLEKNELGFAPALAAKQNSASQIAMGHVFKVVFVFHEPPWKAGADIHFVMSPELTFGAHWLWGVYDSKVVTSWSGGRRSERLIGLSLLRKEVIDAALTDLALASGVDKAKLKSLLAVVDFYDWESDPFSQGAYSYLKVGGAAARAALAQPIQETLYFAGEATMSDASAATVHGALRSGYRAAKEFLRDRS
jgi:monoamine oxidase